MRLSAMLTTNAAQTPSASSPPRSRARLRPSRAATPLLAHPAHRESEDHGDDEARRGTGHDEPRVMHRIGVQEVARGVEDGGGTARPPSGRPPPWSSAARTWRSRTGNGGWRGRGPCGRRDGQAGHHDVDDRGHRFEGHRLESEYSATRTAPATNRMTSNSDSRSARISCDSARIVTTRPCLGACRRNPARVL